LWKICGYCHFTEAEPVFGDIHVCEIETMTGMGFASGWRKVFGT